MKFMKIKLLLTTVLAITFVLSACTGSKNNDDGNASESPSASQQPSASAEPSPEPSSEKLTLNWFVPSPADATYPESDADFIGKVIEEKFNVDLKIQNMVSGADYDAKIGLLIASGDTPDLFVAKGVDSQKYIMDGVTADMTPYVTPEKMPNYFKWLSELELQRYAVQKKFERAPLIFPREVYRSYYVRKDWLDKLGMQVPTNFDETMAVLKAFADKDPDGNGKDDTFGMSAVGNGNSLSWDFPHWIQNGLIGALMVADNKYVDVQSDLKVEHVIQGVIDMTKAKQLDPDWFLQKGTAHEDKAVGGKVGVIVGGTKDYAFDSNPTSIQNRTKAVNPNADWAPFHPFAATGTWVESLPDIPFMFSKQTAEKEPEKIERMVQILDWMASEEGFLLINYGEEGKHYTREGNKITVTQAHLDALKKDAVEQGNFMPVYKFFYSQAPEHEVLGLEVFDERMTDRDRNIVKTIQSYKLHPSIGTNVAPPQDFVLADFRKVMREYQVKALFENKDASKWRQYHEELMTKHGGQKMIDAYTEQIRAAGVIK